MRLISEGKGKLRKIPKPITAALRVRGQQIVLEYEDMDIALANSINPALLFL